MNITEMLGLQDERLESVVKEHWAGWVAVEPRLGVVDEIFTDPLIRHNQDGTEVTSLAAYKGRLSEIQRALSRVDTTIDDRVVQGDKVWTRATSRGINRETGERTIVTWLLVQRVEAGRIAEHWVATFPGIQWTT